MSYLFGEPDSILVVSDTSIDGLVSTLRERTSGTVETVSGADALAETLQARDDIGCVVLASSVADGVETDDAAGVDRVVDAVRNADYGDRLPVVVFANDKHATAVARYEGCRYVPLDTGVEALAAVVADAQESYADRRREAAESSILRTLLYETNFPIFAKDEQARHVYMTDLESHRDPVEDIGKRDYEIASDEATGREAYEDDLSVIETGEPIYDKVEAYDMGGGYSHWVETTKVPWEVDGEIRGVVGFSREINKRKEYERRLREQNERIDEFVSYLSHDLRTPLQVIYSSIDRARMGEEAGLDRIREAAERIEDIVDDLARLSKDKQPLDLSTKTLQTLTSGSLTTQLVPLIDEVWAIVAPDEATLHVDLPETTVVGAPVEILRPVVENLLKNAVDHGSTSSQSGTDDAADHGSTSSQSGTDDAVGHGGDGVTVRIGATDTNGIYVADDGPGIPESEREDVFRAGYTTSEDGTGTGLDIVARTAEQQDWTLNVTASATGGARLEIEGLTVVTHTPAAVEPVEPIALDQQTDVGDVPVPGSASYDVAADEWTVVGSGQNIWDDIHEFHYVHGSAQPPVRLEGRILDLERISEYTKAGFAIRAGVAETEPFGYVGLSVEHGPEVTWRESGDGFTDSEQFEGLAGDIDWYRIEYVDGTVTCYLSPTGEEWYPIDQRSLSLGEPVSLGLVVCSLSSEESAEAVFADVQASRLDVD